MVRRSSYSTSSKYSTTSIPAPYTTPFDTSTTGKLAFYATPPLSPSAYRASNFDPPLVDHAIERLGGMEGDNHQRRQSDQSSYTSSRDYGSSVRGLPRESVSSRFRQSQQLSSLPSPTSVPRTSTGSSHQGLGGYGYASGQQQYATQLQDSSSFQYQPDFAQDSQRQQQLTPYPQNMMYNIQQQVNTQSPYDPVSQYNPRQSAAVEVLSTQFGVPQGYYHSGESTSTSGPASIPYTSTHYQQYQQPTLGGRATLPTYPVAMNDYTESTGPGVMDQPQSAQDANFTDEYNAYSQTLKQTFSDAQSGRLVEAGQSLLDISRFLLGHAVELGLEKNAPDLHSERIKLWNEFNTCWLAVLQKQKDMTEDMLRTGQTVHIPQSILQEDFLSKMGNEIVQLCDGLERHGLVDYQMGVWEEEIISALEDCLDLLEGDDEALLAATSSGSHTR